MCTEAPRPEAPGPDAPGPGAPGRGPEAARLGRDAVAPGPGPGTGCRVSGARRTGAGTAAGGTTGTGALAGSAVCSRPNRSAACRAATSHHGRRTGNEVASTGPCRRRGGAYAAQPRYVRGHRGAAGHRDITPTR